MGQRDQKDQKGQRESAYGKSGTALNIGIRLRMGIRLEGFQKSDGGQGCAKACHGWNPGHIRRLLPNGIDDSQ